MAPIDQLPSKDEEEKPLRDSNANTSSSPSYWWPLMADCVLQEEREVLANFILTTSRLTYGDEIVEFERQWSEWNNSANSIFVNSGTSANYLIITACKNLYGWNHDSGVLVPAVTWGTTISSLINLGVKPVPVDVNINTLSMDLNDAERKIDSNTKAIFITHLLGLPHDMDAVMAFAKKHKLILLEDSCESHGAMWRNKKVGNFGLASSYSFYWGHHLTTIEGGMVCTPNEDFADVIRSLRNHGLTRDMKGGRAIEKNYPDIDKRFLFWTSGYNARGTETHAKLGQLQLKNLSRFIDQRNENYRLFVLLTGKYSKYFSTFYPPLGGEASSYALAFMFKSESLRREISEVMEINGIETRPLVTGNLAKQPFMQSYINKDQLLPGAERIHTCGMYIGNNQFIDQEYLERLDTILENWLSTKSN